MIIDGLKGGSGLSTSAQAAIELGTFVTRCKAKCSGRGVPQRHSFFQKGLHSLIGLEGASFPPTIDHCAQVTAISILRRLDITLPGG